MADAGAWRFVLFVGAVVLASGGCGDEPRGDETRAGGAGGQGGATSGASGAAAGGVAGKASTGGGAAVAGGGASRAGAAGSDTAEGGDATGGSAPTGAAGAAGAVADGQGGSESAPDCGDAAGFMGELAGIFTTDAERVAYGDANLAGVVAAYPEFDAVWEVDVDVHDAVVTATSGATAPGVSAAQSDFWIADDNVLLKVALDPELGPSCCPDFELRPGMRISFNATEVSLFASLGQITAANGFSVGTQGNCVLVAEPEQINDVDFYQLIRISGQLSGEPYGGDGWYNWQLGLSDAVLYDLLTPRANLQVGQTVTFVGPVSPYVGYHRLVEANSAWVDVH